MGESSNSYLDSDMRNLLYFILSQGFQQFGRKTIIDFVFGHILYNYFKIRG